MEDGALIWGLRIQDLINIAAILLGPLFAVAITLFIEDRRGKRDTRIMLARMIVDTRHLPGDSRYNTAINLIPVEFNGDPKVMAAWKKYIDHVRLKPSDDNKTEHEKISGELQTKLIYQILTTMGFSLSETDIQASPYFSEGAAIRDNMYLASLHGTVRIANAMEKQIDYILGQGTEPAGRQSKPAGNRKRK